VSFYNQTEIYSGPYGRLTLMSNAFLNIVKNKNHPIDLMTPIIFRVCVWSCIIS